LPILFVFLAVSRRIVPGEQLHKTPQFVIHLIVARVAYLLHVVKAVVFLLVKYEYPTDVGI
jgi:hypothetical protein